MADQDTQRRVSKFCSHLSSRVRKITRACVSLLDFLLHVRIYLVVFGVGENQLPGKVVVGANNIYHVDNVTIWPLRFSASSLFFPRDQIFIVNFQSKSKSFFLNLTLPFVTPSWIACLSLRTLNILT